VWVVEMKIGERWEPTVGCALERADAAGELAKWRGNNPHDAFRVRRYVCIEKAVKRGSK